MFFSRKSKLSAQEKQQVSVTKAISSSQVNTESMKVFDFEGNTELVLAFVSPHCDFAKVSQNLKSCMPFAKQIIAIMTAGELGGGEKTYHDTPSTWDNIVIHAFSSKLIESLSLHEIKLHSADLKAGNPTLNH